MCQWLGPDDCVPGRLAPDLRCGNTRPRGLGATHLQGNGTQWGENNVSTSTNTVELRISGAFFLWSLAGGCYQRDYLKATRAKHTSFFCPPPQPPGALRLPNPGGYRRSSRESGGRVTMSSDRRTEQELTHTITDVVLERNLVMKGILSPSAAPAIVCVTAATIVGCALTNSSGSVCRRHKSGAALEMVLVAAAAAGSMLSLAPGDFHSPPAIDQDRSRRGWILHGTGGGINTTKPLSPLCTFFVCTLPLFSYYSPPPSPSPSWDTLAINIVD